jgi:hypothetical protein
MAGYFVRWHCRQQASRIDRWLHWRGGDEEHGNAALCCTF